MKPDATIDPPMPAEGHHGFSPEQKAYLDGLFAGVAQRRLHPYAGEATPPAPPTEPDPGTVGIHGTPIEDVCKQELWKHELHGLDAWERLLEHADANKTPDEADTFRFRYHGLFYVAPAQNSFMLRCRIPAGELTAAQFRGLAELADEFGNGKAAITTRSNIQIREIAPANLVNTLTRLQSLGLTAKGSGVDNVRNITASPTAGLDPQELIDTRPFAHALHHYILNQRDLYDLPRKFNVAFEGGGAIDTVADTNDIGFVAVSLLQRSSLESVSPPAPLDTAGSSAEAEDPPSGLSLRDDSRVSLNPGVYFRIELAGITGHRQLASDCGLLVKPSEAVAVAVAMIRVFIENGDRTDRKKARLKYLVDRWGVDRFLVETQKKLAFPLVRLRLDRCRPRSPAIRHGHIGVYRQKQRGRNYLGVVIPVGVMTTRQMRRLSDLAAHHGSGNLRLTPWQNLLIPDVPDAFVETVKRALVRAGLHYETTNILGGLVACTGNTGCKWASTDTKGQAVALGEHLNRRLRLDSPVNIHLTGCPNSCAQHYVGDIGLQGVKVASAGDSVEGYNVVLGGGTGAGAGIGRQVFTGIAFSEIPALLERVLSVYQSKRQAAESFSEFTRRHGLKELQEMFSP